MAEKYLAAPGRHDMLFLSAEAMDFARRAALRRNPGLSPEDAGHWLCAEIPAIITRQSRRRPKGLWEAGFSLPIQQGGVRLRFRTLVPLAGAARLVTPFGAARESLEAIGETPRAVLAGLSALGARHGLEVGVYGSLALQILTGLPYFTDASDYDITLSPAAPHPGLPGFYREALALGEHYGARLDMEIACLENSGAKLAEVLSGQKTVLCKGLFGIRLCPPQALWPEKPESNPAQER